MRLRLRDHNPQREVRRKLLVGQQNVGNRVGRLLSPEPPVECIALLGLVVSCGDRVPHQLVQDDAEVLGRRRLWRRRVACGALSQYLAEVNTNMEAEMLQ